MPSMPSLFDMCSRCKLMFLLSETQTADLQVLQMDVIDEAALALQECSLFVYPIIIIILLPFYLYVILFDRNFICLPFYSSDILIQPRTIS